MWAVRGKAFVATPSGDILGRDGGHGREDFDRGFNREGLAAMANAATGRPRWRRVDVRCKGDVGWGGEAIRNWNVDTRKNRCHDVATRGRWRPRGSGMAASATEKASGSTATKHCNYIKRSPG